MYSVDVVQMLPASHSDVKALLTPEAVVRYEGSHEPKSVTESGGRTIVTTRPSGRLLPLRYTFESTDSGFQYRRETDGRPLVVVETTMELTSRNGETEIRLYSAIEPTIALPFFGRYLERRRRKQLGRLCDRLTDELRPR